PSFNCFWMWEKIFDHYGWTYSGPFDFSAIEELWMTYPTALEYENNTETDLLTDLRMIDQKWYHVGEYDWRAKWAYNNNTVDPAYGEIVNNGWEYQNYQAGYFQVKFRIN